MFCPEDLIGLSSSRKSVVLLNGRQAYHVKLHMVQFSRAGMAKIGQLINDIGYRFGLHESKVKELMKDRLYTVPPNPSLYFLFSIPELEVDVHAEIPRKFWRYTEMASERPLSVALDEQKLINF
ncbi:hypothetical protein [Maridesulfovibrio bastinii]|uniref:hypothetical protein n=1 Tax=Maridesulfovibrio bastinii TaxID=47157 RepID=UPI0004107A39|nr:hypothetical protein [Maridesulfovibrio bastinii]